MSVVSMVAAVLRHIVPIMVSLQWFYPPKRNCLLIGDVDPLPRFIELGVNRVKGNILIPFLLLIPLSLGIIIFSLRALLALLLLF